VATPASPADAKGLLVSALRGTGPVVLLENRALYELEEDVPEEPVAIPFGKGKIVRPGKDITIVGASLMAYESARAAEILADHGVDAEVIDPRSIRPFDQAMLLESIRKTGRLVVADTSWAFCGFAAEVAAVAVEKGWEYLKAPVRRVTPPDCPAPVSRPLEEAFHPSPLTIAQTCLDLLKTDVSIRRGVSDVQSSFAGPY
jgi:pyruvate dehydrogenase E1 component beta subunit